MGEAKRAVKTIWDHRFQASTNYRLNMCGTDKLGVFQTNTMTLDLAIITQFSLSSWYCLSFSWTPSFIIIISLNGWHYCSHFQVRMPRFRDEHTSDFPKMTQWSAVSGDLISFALPHHVLCSPGVPNFVNIVWVQIYFILHLTYIFYGF